MKGKGCTLLMLAQLTFCSAALAFGYNYTAPKEFRESLERGKPVIIVDIQAPAEFAQHHFKGAIETDAFPVKSEAERRRLDQVLPVIGNGNDQVVIVCPRGGGGAKNAYDYLKSKGVDEKRLRILENGMQGWPYPALAVKGGTAPAAGK
jgi:rhodanese-related sulfurtransferase